MKYRGCDEGNPQKQVTQSKKKYRVIQAHKYMKDLNVRLDCVNCQYCMCKENQNLFVLYLIGIKQTNDYYDIQ